MPENKNKKNLTIRDVVHLSTIAMFLDQTGNMKFDTLLDPISDEVLAAFDKLSDEEIEDELGLWISEITGVPVSTPKV